MKLALWSAIFVGVFALAAHAADTFRMAVTTSFHNSGLADVLLPEIRADLGLDVHVLVVGTGQAMKLGRSGDVDAILVHARAAEEEFVAAGYATHRREIMYNDFVVIGPNADPADVQSAANIIDALQRIAESRPRFVSRADDSGTHNKELSLWAKTGLDPEAFGRWYNEVGAGMGTALNTASAMNAYILADRASWLNFGNKNDLALLFSGDPALFNQYAYLPINSARHPHVKADLAAKLEGWLSSPRAEMLIDTYEIDSENLFVFNAQDK